MTGSYVMNSLITFAAEFGRQLRLKAYASFLLSQVAGLVANTATIVVASYCSRCCSRSALRAGAGRQGAGDRRELSWSIFRCRISSSSGSAATRPLTLIRHGRRARCAHDENLTTERPTFVTHLECSATGERYPADEVHNLSRAGKPLLVRYDLAGVRKALSKEALARGRADLWRYRELLPVRRVAGHRQPRRGDDAARAACRSSPAKLGGGEILVKDEGRLPTGSFKARGLVMAVSMAQGARHHAHGDADQRQCRRGARRLCQPLPASRPRSSARRTRRR